MNIIDELTEYFRKFPGVGPRQAQRFVYYLLRVSNSKNQRISELISKLKNETTNCISCNRTFLSAEKNIECEVCRNKNRDHTTLLIIENDTDFEAIERSRVYNGLYFVIGSLIKILDNNYQEKVNFDKLLNNIKNKIEIKEIIFGLDATPDGENTIEILKKDLIKQLSNGTDYKFSVLGRGLSSGTEIEYTDSETLKNAINSRF